MPKPHDSEQNLRAKYPNLNQDFLREEYESLRNEQLQKIAETHAITKFTLVAVGAIWTWVATHKVEIPYPLIAIICPIVITLFFAILFYTLRSDIGVLGEKIKKLEEWFEIPPEVAWERDLTQTYTRTTQVKWAFWVLLLALNAVFTVLLCI